MAKVAGQMAKWTDVDATAGAATTTAGYNNNDGHFRRNTAHSQRSGQATFVAQANGLSASTVTVDCVFVCLSVRACVYVRNQRLA